MNNKIMIIMDYIVEIANQFNKNNKRNVIYRLILKLAYKNTFDKIKIRVLTEKLYKKLTKQRLSSFLDINAIDIYEDSDITDDDVKYMNSLNTIRIFNNNNITDESIKKTKLILFNCSSSNNITEQALMNSKESLKFLSIVNSNNINTQYFNEFKNIIFYGYDFNECKFQLKSNIKSINIVFNSFTLDNYIKYANIKDLYMPIEHINFNYLPLTLHILQLGISYSDYISILNGRKYMLRELKLTSLSIMTAQQFMNIDIINIIKTYFNYSCISYIYFNNKRIFIE